MFYDGNGSMQRTLCALWKFQGENPKCEWRWVKMWIKTTNNAIHHLEISFRH